MRKKRRMAELFVIFPMIFLMLTACGSAGYKKEVEENFTDNDKNEPYARQIPLDEMDFQVYDDYFPKIRAMILYNYDRKISLPCDVEYYESKEDSEPILTLEKGTKVYVLPDNERTIEGYGWCCWPDYEEGWRYGNPFLTIDFTYISEEYPMYYVKSEQLEKVAEAFYESNRDSFSSIRKKDYVRRTTQYIDQILYDNGAYISKALLEK